MEFLKKNYEKIALAIVSLLLILTATQLMRPLQVDKDNIVKEPANFARVPGLDTNEFLKVSALLKTPQEWSEKDNAQIPFLTEIWVWDGKYLTTTNDIVKDIKVEEGPKIPIYDLEWSTTFKTFPMLFMALATGSGDDAQFQINIAGRGTLFKKKDQEFSVMIHGSLETFKITKYDEKKTKRINPSTSSEETVDSSELTLKRTAGAEVKEITLVIGQTKYEEEPVATYVSTTTGERKENLKKGMKFTYGGGSYELLDIKTDKVVVKDLKPVKADKDLYERRTTSELPSGPVRRSPKR